MKDSDHYDHRDRIIEEAAEWFARLQDSAVSAEERAAFAAWVSASSLHVREYLALSSLHADIRELTSPPSVEELVRLADVGNVVEGAFAAAGGPRAEPGSRDVFRTGRKLTMGLAVAASIALAALAGLWWVHPNPDSAVYATAAGEQKSFPLPDGTLVTLNAVSRLQVRYTESRRDIELLSGEALFSVARNPQRPFRVLTSDSVVQAIGTRFNVRHRRNGTTVTVVEGTVEVRALNVGDAADSRAAGTIVPQPVQITADQRAQVGLPEQAIAVRSVDSATDIAWRERRLIFESRRLGDVVDEFNLYNGMPLEIDAEALQHIRVSGSFYADDPRSFALFLQEAGLARLDFRPARIVLLIPDAKRKEN